MNNTRPLILLLFTNLLLFFSSCSDDETSIKPTNTDTFVKGKLQEISVSTSDFSVTIDENPIEGQSLGFIEGETNIGNLTFSLNSEHEQTAFSIDPSTGELFVNDVTQFDYEKNKIVEGEVKVSNGDVYELAKITVHLNDLEENYNCEQYANIAELLFNELTSQPEFSTEYSIDLTTHEYSFSVAVPGSICSIGYRGYDASPYLIEIVDENDQMVYSGIHSFSSTSLEYVSVGSINLEANKKYTIRRIKDEYSNFEEIIGDIIIGTNDIEFPVSYGDLTILGSDFYGSGGPIPDAFIPLIAFNFKPD